MRAPFDEPLTIKNMVHDLGMSVTVFHHHFKSDTAMSRCSIKSTSAWRRLAALGLAVLDYFRAICIASLREFFSRTSNGM